jgi:hypothetical protein
MRWANIGGIMSGDNLPKTYVGICKIISGTIIELIETKHLYQSISIDEDKLKPIFAFFHENSNMKQKEVYSFPLSLVKGSWYLTSGEDNYNLEQIKLLDMLTIHIARIRALCPNCENIQPMNLIKSDDVLQGINKNGHALYMQGIQLFSTTLLCQNCRIPAETFFIFRNNVKLTLCGRNPMEMILAPREIPNNVKKYYSDSIIAKNSGKTLAGLFYLRTMIEQYLRNKYQQVDETIDKLIERYMADLPEDFKKRHPSIKEIYSKLSAAIHRAEESTELFDDSIEKINIHFEAKRIYRIE